jgi:hypothetical protein
MTPWLPRAALVGWTCLVWPAGVLAQETPKAPAPGPRLEISKAEHDLGRIPQGSKRVVNVTLRNSGDQILEIRKVRTTCPCVKASPTAASVPAGKDVAIAVEIEPTPMEESIEEEILLYTNDRATPLGRIRITGSVGGPIRILPPAVAVGAIYRGDLDRMEVAPVRLIAADRTPLGEVKLSPSKPWIHPTATKLDDGSFEVTIKLTSAAPVGPLKESVRVETDRAAVVQIPVLGTVVGDLDSGGRRVDFGLIKEQQPASVTFRLPNRGENPIKIMRAEAKIGVPAEVEVTPEDKVFKIVLRVGPQPAFARLTGAIELHTDAPDEPLVRLEVYGGVLGTNPFDQAKAEGSDDRFFEIVKDALRRGERIPEAAFFAQVFGGVKDERAVSMLTRAATEADLAARMRAVELLAGFKTPEVIDRLRFLTTDDSHHFVRRLALVGYAEAKGKASVPTLLLALQDDDPWVREDAAIYLGKLGDASVIPALKAALNDPDQDASNAIRAALATLQASAKVELPQ